MKKSEEDDEATMKEKSTKKRLPIVSPSRLSRPAVASLSLQKSKFCRRACSYAPCSLHPASRVLRNRSILLLMLLPLLHPLTMASRNGEKNTKLIFLSSQEGIE